ncbi:helix-turn-helix domain-containing protein [Hymenobacter glacieicola]|uniref:HTH cro/C1-type domain-containing protein n=1 Tax=Hymenobacter glacieicola TaxID=1562124 RepID=A0ABQ1X7Q1_9BACT|nr:helix-turn-helix transcriptional regulator [Hymenobacter glacieicola]GGG59470.1 hypothetical protein GCM10011378_39320 [Hymenobacter glacieicola]
MSLHQRLKQLRILRKLSQQQMADRLYMSRSAYTKLEANTAGIRIELLHRIAAVLQVPATLLVSAQAAPNTTPWNDFDFMLEMAYEYLSWTLAVVPYDDLTLEQLALVTSKGFGSREAYENTPHRGRLYSRGPQQIIREMLSALSFSTLFEHHLVQHPTWLAHWGRHQLAEARRAVVATLPTDQQEALVEEPEVDGEDYLMVFLITLIMPDGSDQHLELAQRDIPIGMDEEQALQQLIISRGALGGDILCFTYDGYTCAKDIVTDVYAS